MTPEYAAGFFDGEGCVYLRINPKLGWADIRVEIQQVDRKPLDALADFYGGTIREAHKRSHEKTRYRWLLTKGGMKRFLEDVYPHCLVKKSQVWLALEYLAQDQSLQGQKMTSEAWALRKGFSLALQYEKG